MSARGPALDHSPPTRAQKYKQPMRHWGAAGAELQVAWKQWCASRITATEGLSLVVKLAHPPLVGMVGHCGARCVAAPVMWTRRSVL
jgi:hypothetical protein